MSILTIDADRDVNEVLLIKLCKDESMSMETRMETLPSLVAIVNLVLLESPASGLGFICFADDLQKVEMP